MNFFTASYPIENTPTKIYIKTKQDLGHLLGGIFLLYIYHIKVKLVDLSGKYLQIIIFLIVFTICI